MPKRTTDDIHPFQALEESAYQAFREWPVWLVLRERELDTHLAGAARQLLRALARHLNNPAAIRRWIKEASKS